MTIPVIKLKPQRPDRRRHPWVYDNEIADGPDAAFEDGDVVKVRDSRGRIQGAGYLNSRSRIAFRYLTRNPDENIDATFWRKRVKAAYDYRVDRYAYRKQLPGAYRLIHGEADGIPGLVADVYGKYVVVQFLALGLEQFREDIIQGIVLATSAEGVYERSDSTIRELEGLEQVKGVVWGQEPPDLLEFEDEGAILLANIKNGAKTGLFLDQLENQKAAAREAHGRDVLNCFSYTGIFGLRSGLMGAKSVTDVEISEHFNALNEKQWERNGLSVPHKIVTENVFDHLRELDTQDFRTDMIILDPPAFTKKRANREGAIRGYNEINRMALKLLRPGGVLVTCSCSHHLTVDEFSDIVYGASVDAHRELKLIELRGQPADHPVLLDAPESSYLKCMILAVS
ncbi:MAG: class I SAM-dependent rRNA methyltransferase [Candidatus Obscuribacterales bacterium]|nr:class I SAM-dependent rRNA methyltransferase [Candidatus Obscuribacterales bacterium]